MKNILLLLSFCVLAFQGIAQTQVATVNGALYLPENSYVYYWGATTDTLIASDDITLNLRVRGSATHNIAIVLYATKVSGTVTNTFVTYYSMDGVNYTSTGDTITLSNASTGLKGTINLDDYPYPYLRIKGAAGATAQKAYYKVFAISRAE